MARKPYANFNWSGVWKKYQKDIIRKKQKDGRVINTIRLMGKDQSERINNFFVKYGNYVAIGACLRFSETAAKYTPPNMGKANIDDKYYYRPIYKLRDLAKGLCRLPNGRRLHATKEDFEALRNGYEYKVVNTKYGVKKGTVFAYTKGINQAKRASRIERRGLAKYSWGSMINNTTQDIANQLAKGGEHGVQPETMEIFRAQKLPPIFTRLARKSPAITKYVWGTYDWDYQPSNKDVKKIKLSIENRLAQIQTYGRIAIQQGLRVVRSYINSLWKGIDVATQYKGTQRTGHRDDPTFVAVTDLRNSLVKMFDAATSKYGIEYLHITRNKGEGTGNLNILNKG